MFSLYPLANDENQTYGLISLTPKFRHVLQMAFEQYEICHQVFFDRQLTPRDIWKMRLQQVKNLSGLQGIHAMKRLTADMVEEQAQYRQQQWREANARNLTQGMFTRLRDKAHAPYAIAQLNELESRWTFHGNFAHFGNQALVRAMQQLGHIEVFVNLARNELISTFQKRRWFQTNMPEPWYCDYKHYLDNTLKIINEEKHRITASMYERLRIAADEHDLTSGDVFMHTIDRLKQLHSIKETFGRNINRERNLTPALFKQYHEYIFSSATEVVKQRTLQLPWFTKLINQPTVDNASSAGNGPLDLKKHIAKQFNLESEVPTKLRRPIWLFKGRAIRYQLFDDVYGWASLAVSSQRLDQWYDNDLDDPSLEQFCLELIHVNSGIAAVEEKIKQSEASLISPLRKPFTKRTQAFLINLKSKLQDIKTHEQQKLIQFLRKLERSITQDLLALNERLESTIHSLKSLEISNKPEIKAAFATLALAIRTSKERQQLRSQTLNRLEEANIILAPLRQQSRLVPAAEAEIIRALDYYQALPVRDDVVAYVTAEFDKLLIDATRNLSLPSPLLREESAVVLADYQRDYQYLTNLGRILKVIGKRKERGLVDNTIDEVLCHYLQSWAGDETAPCSSVECMHAKAEIQSTFIQALGDEETLRLIEHAEALRHEGRYEELKYLASAHLRKYERRIVDRVLAKQFKQCEEQLFQYIASKPELGLTQAQSQHFSQLANKMADARISDVKELNELTITDRAFLGIGAGFFEQWFHNRKLLITCINLIARIRIAASHLPYLPSKEQRQRYLQELHQQLDEQSQKLGDKHIQRIIQHSFFNSQEQRTENNLEIQATVPKFGRG